MRIVFPGSFDPITKGHIEIIERTVKTFGNVEVLILNNISKKSLFSVDERLWTIREIFKDRKEISVNSYDGLLSEYVLMNDINLIVRGIRNTIDFESEKTLSKINFDLTKGIETIFFSSNSEFISSSMVKELYKFNGDFENYVDDIVVDMFKKKNEEDL